jgi:aminocarboxymuconate-semialdehyde decarboxylase
MKGSTRVNNARRRRGSGFAGGTAPVVDVHCHAAVFECEKLVEDLYRVEYEPYDHFSSEMTVAHNRSLFPELRVKLTDPKVRLADMDRMGIDIQGVASFVSQYYYWAPPDLGVEVARVQNDGIAEMVATQPDRFFGLATLPLQDAALAIAEMERAVGQLGFRAVQIGSNIAGKDLDHPSLRPFFVRAAEMKVPVLIHPNGFTGGERMADYFLINIVGNPLDSTMALIRLIFSGLLAEIPDLRVIGVHGGGYLGSYQARMDHAWEVRPECRLNISEPPSAYLRRQVYLDHVVFTPAAVAFLVGQMGADHVVLGTDYPFDMGEADPVGLVKAVPGLSTDDRRLIQGGNAVRLLGLD